MTSLLWLRRDLRRHDHPALLAARDAAGDGDLVVAFVVDPRLWEGGGAARRAVPGADMLRAMLCSDGDVYLYVISVLRKDGRVVHVVVDGPSGKVGAVQ